MAERVSASIAIGGNLPAGLLATFVAIVQNEGLSTQWDGPGFEQADLPEDAPLSLMAHEVAWGRFADLEAFCLVQGLPFARWSGACPGQWGPERVVFAGIGEPVGYAADEDDYIVVGRGTVERLGSYEAILAHFAAADFAVPPLVVAEERTETGNG